MLVGHGAISTSGYRYGTLAGKLTDSATYKGYKAKVDAAPTLVEKLKAIKADQGMYDESGVSEDARSRSVLFELIIEGPLEALPNGADVECVLKAALNGAPDSSYYGVLVPTGANVQDLCTTDMTIEQALDALAKVDKQAAAVVASGVQTAVPAAYSDYKGMLATKFKDRFFKNLNPLQNPVTQPLLIGLGVFAVALLLIQMSKRK